MKNLSTDAIVCEGVRKQWAKVAKMGAFYLALGAGTGIVGYHYLTPAEISVSEKVCINNTAGAATLSLTRSTGDRFSWNQEGTISKELDAFGPLVRQFLKTYKGPNEVNESSHPFPLQMLDDTIRRELGISINYHHIIKPKGYSC